MRPDILIRSLHSATPVSHLAILSNTRSPGVLRYGYIYFLLAGLSYRKSTLLLPGMLLPPHPHIFLFVLPDPTDIFLRYLMSKPDLNRPLLPVYFPFSLSRHTTNSVIMKPVSPLRHISTTSVPCADGQRELRTSFPSLFSRHLLHRSVNNFLFHLHSIAFLFCKKVTGVLPIHQSNFPISLFLPGKVHPPNQVVSDGVCNYCRIPTFYKIC